MIGNHAGTIFKTVIDDGKSRYSKTSNSKFASSIPSSNLRKNSVLTESNSHNQSNNLSHYLHNDNKKHENNYQSSQRKHRSSHHNQHDRRSSPNLGFSADKEIIAIATDEARYNLATRIMSNGVEVIVAGDRTTLPGGHPNNHLRILTTTEAFKMPLTLAPSTLKDHMLLLLPQSTITSNHTNGIHIGMTNQQHLPSIKNTEVSIYNLNK